MHTYTFKLDDGTTFTCRAKGFFGAYVTLCKDRNRDFKGVKLFVKEDDGNFNQV